MKKGPRVPEALLPLEPFESSHVRMLDGDAPFHRGGDPLGFTLANFWRWSSSNLLNNAVRGVLAEYLVARSLGDVASCPRSTWEPWDVVTSGGVKVEVKSAAYVQSWHQKKRSPISFGIAPTVAPSETQAYGGSARRHADVYVMCVLHTASRSAIDPMDLGQWSLYVISRREIDDACGEQKTIALGRLRDLGARSVGFDGLAGAVAEAALPSQRRPA